MRPRRRHATMRAMREYNKKKITVVRFYAMLITRARREGAQREIIALSITLMIGAKAKIGGGWTVITIECAYIAVITTTSTNSLGADAIRAT